LNEVLNGDVYELEFAFARPAAATAAGNAPIWTQRAMQILNDVHAAKANFTLKADRYGHLADNAKRWVRQMLNEPGLVKKVKVRLTDETQLLDVAVSLLRDQINVELFGMYPRAQDVLAELELAYDRNRERIAQQHGN
jgi:hypothetical protein